MKNLTQQLVEREAAGLYRRRRIVEGPQQPPMVVDGRAVLNFCSNDYLGLANHPKLITALQQGAERYGAGSGAAHLVSGHSRAHHQLEEELAAFTGRPRALLFSTGYMANLGVISALLGPGDAAFEDRLNHASLLDGALLSRARLSRYAHADASALSAQLAASKAQHKMVISDGVFSMDGEIAPLPPLAEAARQHDAWLMIDDAHGFGVLGERGAGTLEHFGVGEEQVPVLMATLGKALGSFGAFVAGSESLIETLINHARPYIYTTAMPAAQAEVSRAALRLLHEEAWRREQLRSSIHYFRNGAAQLGLPMQDSPTAIQPLMVGSASEALRLSEALYQDGLWISAIRPPTVPEGSARLRITLSAAHDQEQIAQLLEALDKHLNRRQSAP
ncbi:MAG: 8-amino-7-oxononanoate synthase [Chromatiales bacterium]|nr:8-amino-7-oxononanoate synthase [Gammaproteobacteria bacterium]MBW6476376.1 8-amino-7-oxononanoate synthase [Chromatiales bacterium]